MIARSWLASSVAVLAIGSAVVVDAAPAASTVDPSARPGRLVELPDHRRLNFRCAGHGKPTVVFESGFGADSLAWYKVQPVLAARYRVCAYDRAGAGFSDLGPAPRDGATIAADLDAGLRAAAIGGPFVLVGHSSGGLYARIFADLRRRDVVGMVLVDPSVAHQDRRFAERFGPGAGSLQSLIKRSRGCLAAAQAGALPSPVAALAACVPAVGSSPELNARHLAEARTPGRWLDQISELETLWTSTSDEIDHGRTDYGNMPLIVLTADGTYAQNPATVRSAVDDLWTKLHQEIAALSTRGHEERVAHSSHLMMLDRPDAIVAAVERVIEQAEPRKVSRPRAERGT